MFSTVRLTKRHCQWIPPSSSSVQMFSCQRCPKLPGEDKKGKITEITTKSGNKIKIVEITTKSGKNR